MLIANFYQIVGWNQTNSLYVRVGRTRYLKSVQGVGLDLVKVNMFASAMILRRSPQLREIRERVHPRPYHGYLVRLFQSLT